MKIIFLLYLIIFAQSGNAQIGVITHREAPTNLYKSPAQNSDVVRQLYFGEVFFIDLEHSEFPDEWVSIWIPANHLSKLYSGQEHGVSGFVHRSKIKKLEETPKTEKKDILLIFETAQTFVANKSIDKQGYVDGLFPYGSEGHLFQSFEIQKMQLVWQGDTFELSSYFFNDLFNIHYKSGILTSASEKFKTYKSGNTYYIHHSCGDGGGYYEVVWVIRNGKILQRLAGWWN